MLSPISHMLERLEKTRDDSDVAYFYDLLHVGEMIVKLATSSLIACVDDDRERHRYRLEYAVIHADSLGTWSATLDDALSGPASQYLVDGARTLQRELSQPFRVGQSAWQAEVMVFLHDAMHAIDTGTTKLSTKVSARRWFSDFVTIRNRTRGHGATTPSTCSAACDPLRKSIDLLVEHFFPFNAPWAHLHRNLSGKYRVTSLGNGLSQFESLKSSTEYAYEDGIYMWLDAARKITLVSSDEDLRDFYLPNGGYNEKTYELLCYVTDRRITAEAGKYALSPTALPPSQTQGLGELDTMGNVFANLPPHVKGYVTRKSLEDELASVLLDQNHPVITLIGRGGIGKTSLALEVLYQVAESDRYFAIVWLSARDIELLPEGPKHVRAHVLTPDEIAHEYVELIQPTDLGKKDFDSLSYFAQSLGEPGDTPTLFVFDNFETVRSPVELHRWLDSQVRSPNKILLTTRRREFKGDYWVEVGGMTEPEFQELISKTADELAVTGLIDPAYIDDLYRESDGHPYIAKVILGEIARSGKTRKVARVIASQDRMLDALFDRTFTQLSPAGQRIFLTLSSWQSFVPEVALEAAVNRPDNERIDIQRVVDELHRSSLLQLTTTDKPDVYLGVPLAAALFGKRKLGVSPWQVSVEADTEILRLFGVVQVAGVRHGFDSQIERLFQNVADRLQRHPSEFERYRPVLEFVSRERPIGWIYFAQILEEYRPSQGWDGDVITAYRHYLEAVPGDGEIWRTLAHACKGSGDHIGAAQALVQRARLPDAPFADLSYAATSINAFLAEEILELDTDEKKVLITSLVDVMVEREAEADATDLSRLAWLLINVDRLKEAKRIVRTGLGRDSTNSHCRKLAQRLRISIP
jgi:hypothetical protein